MGFLVILLAVVEAVGVAGFLLVKAKKKGGNANVALDAMTEELKAKSELAERLDAAMAQLVDSGDMTGKVRELIIARESLKAERGRVTITQAELETIEVRLRELDEISRELEASAVETKEEIKILNKKERDLNQKNEALKNQIAKSLQEIDSVIGRLEMSAQLQEQVDLMKSELVRTESQIETLLGQIQAGNEQYFILKKRYDALDIEYAQLYEKFSEQQAAG